MEVLLVPGQGVGMGEVSPSIDLAIRAALTCLRLTDWPGLFLRKTSRALPAIREAKASELEEGKNGTVEVEAEVLLEGIILELRCELLYEYGWRHGPFMVRAAVFREGSELLYYNCSVVYDESAQPFCRPMYPSRLPR